MNITPSTSANGLSAAVFWQGVALLTVSAFFHALWNALVKRHQKDATTALFLVLLVALGCTVAVQLVTGTQQAMRGPLLYWALAAGVCEGGYFLALGRSLQSGPYGVIYTVTRGAALIFVWVVSVAVFDETLALRAVLGAVLVTFGIGLTSIRDMAMLRALDFAHLKWAIITAAFVAGYHHCYSQSLAAGAVPVNLFSMALSVSLVIFYAAKFKGKKLREIYAGITKRELLFLAAAGIACCASFLLFLGGLHQAGAAIGITIRNTSVVFAQFLAVAIGEKPSLRQWGGAVIVAIGAALVAGP